MNYEAGLANSPMAAGGRSLRVHLGDGADLSAPLSNTYAEHPVVDSPACRALCAAIGEAGLDKGLSSLFRPIFVYIGIPILV